MVWGFVFFCMEPGSECVLIALLHIRALYSKVLFQDGYLSVYLPQLSPGQVFCLGLVMVNISRESKNILPAKRHRL